jgi:hypothetical protein
MTDTPTPMEVSMAYEQAIDEVNVRWRNEGSRHSYIPAIEISARAMEILYGDRDERAA